jgi:hypothetical protein
MVRIRIEFDDCEPDPLAVATWIEKSLTIGLSGFPAERSPSEVTTLDMSLLLEVSPNPEVSVSFQVRQYIGGPFSPQFLPEIVMHSPQGQRPNPSGVFDSSALRNVSGRRALL